MNAKTLHAAIKLTGFSPLVHNFPLVNQCDHLFLTGHPLFFRCPTDFLTGDYRSQKLNRDKSQKLD